MQQGLKTQSASVSHPLPAYEFTGRHLLVSYSDCDREALRDLAGIRRKMIEAVTASGATVLSTVEHVFESAGLTLLLLLSESHASIHTYPEHDSCFLDLFTCGSACKAEAFEAIMRKHLRPAHVDCRVWIRHQGIDPDVFHGA